MQKFFSILILSCLSLFCLTMGLGLFLLKSPMEKIHLYTQSADYFLEKSDDPALTGQSALYLLGQAEILFLRAVTLNPYDLEKQTKIDLVTQRKKELTDDTNTAFLPHKELIP